MVGTGSEFRLKMVSAVAWIPTFAGMTVGVGAAINHSLTWIRIPCPGADPRGHRAGAWKWLRGRPSAVIIGSMTAMPVPEPTHDKSSEAEADARRAAAVARGRADIKAGRYVEHAEVRAWLMSWGTDNPLPRPRPRCE